MRLFAKGGALAPPTGKGEACMLCIERKHVGEKTNKIPFHFVLLASKFWSLIRVQLLESHWLHFFGGVVVNGAISTLGSHLHQHNGPIHPVHSSLSPHPSRGQPCRKKLKRPLHRGFAIAAPSPARDALWLISFHLPSSQVFLQPPWKYPPRASFSGTSCFRSLQRCTRGLNWLVLIHFLCSTCLILLHVVT